MDKAAVQSKIESVFRKQVQSDKKVRNAYLLVNSDKLDVHLNIAEGKTGSFKAHPKQPNHLASVGKLFTATLIGILHEKGDLSFDDRISKFLDDELMNKLHVYKGIDYSDKIRIRHLLNQSSGLNDVFFPLLRMKIKKPEMEISTREAVLWGKNHQKPVSKPGEKHFYTDTNYFLLGLIIEVITGEPFHQVMHRLIFDPLKMDHAYMNDCSQPKVVSEFPTAGAYIENTDFAGFKGIAPLDHAGASVVAPLEEYLIFMKALVEHKILKEETLNQMLTDHLPMGFPAFGLDYGYAIWKVKTVPVLMPGKYNCWGCAGITGANMFYHPGTQSYIILTFNDMSYSTKGLRFMITGVIKQLLKIRGD